jgi:hypothetical protein
VYRLIGGKRKEAYTDVLDSAAQKPHVWEGDCRRILPMKHKSEQIFFLLSFLVSR